MKKFLMVLDLLTIGLSVYFTISNFIDFFILEHRMSKNPETTI